MESQTAIGPALHASRAKLRRVKKRKTATQANFSAKRRARMSRSVTLVPSLVCEFQSKREAARSLASRFLTIDHLHCIPIYSHNIHIL